MTSYWSLRRSVESPSTSFGLIVLVELDGLFNSRPASRPSAARPLSSRRPASAQAAEAREPFARAMSSVNGKPGSVSHAGCSHEGRPSCTLSRNPSRRPDRPRRRERPRATLPPASMNRLFNELVCEHGSRLPLRHPPHRHEADAADIAQQAFIEASNAYGDFRGDSKLSTWLYGIALNLVRNYLSRAPEQRYNFVCETALTHHACLQPNPEQIAAQRNHDGAELGAGIAAREHAPDPQSGGHGKPLVRADRRHPGRAAGHRAQPPVTGPRGAQRMEAQGAVLPF